MKYVFYDAESIDKEHKCSFTFGYLVTDENFNILVPKEDIVFNVDIPKENWDWRAIRNVLKGSYNEKDFMSKKTFPQVYGKIKKLLECDDVLCVGFETNEDVKYLLGNCDKYGLEPINFKYIDLRDIIRFLTGEKSSSLILEYIKYLHKPYFGIHKSCNDAEMTMLILKEILKLYKKTLSKILDENTGFIGVSDGFIYGFDGNKYDIKNPRESKYEKVEKKKLRIAKPGQEDFILRGSLNNILFLRFLDYAEKTENLEQKLKDKKISISLNYEMYNFQNMLKIIQRIKNLGGEYVKKGSLVDIFVKQDAPEKDENGELIPCSKYNYVLEAIEKERKKIEILEFDEFLKLIDLTKEQLENMPNIDVEYLKDEKYGVKQ